jgi:hypothetical protein
MIPIRRAHPREERITFDEPTHTYYVDGKGGFTSVTQKIARFFRPFQRDKIIFAMLRKPNQTRTFDEIAREWREKAAFGTRVHSLIEKYLRDGVQPVGLSSDLARCFGQFVAFWADYTQRHAVVAVRPEMRIWTREWQVAGSVDLLVEFANGTHSLLDWKCVGALRKEGSWGQGLGPLSSYADTNYNHYVLQLNMYKRILERFYDLRIVSLSIVVLHPLQEGWREERLQHVDDDIDALFGYSARPERCAVAASEHVSFL